MKDNSGTVYSTDKGRLCPGCGSPADGCTCSKNSRIIGSGKVKIQFETKGRKGKGLTVVYGLALNGYELLELARTLKKKCSSGGTVKDGVIEIQGDFRDRVKAELSQLGYI